MSNMSTDSILEILSRVGKTTLSKNINVISASPNHTPNVEEWNCTVDLPGYYNSGNMTYTLSAEGSNPQETTDKLLNKLVNFLATDESVTARRKFTDQYDDSLTRYNKATYDERNHPYNRIRHPGERHKEIDLTEML